MIYLLLCISFCLTFFIKEFAIKKSFLAEVNERSSHSLPTPHGGGIAIAVTWFLGLLYVYLNNEIETRLFITLLLGLIIVIVSFLDDLYELSPKIRIVVQIFVAFLAILSLGGLEKITFGIFDISNIIILNLFAVLMIVWYINLYNFLDGINGYAGSEAMFLSLAGFILFGGNYFLVLGVSVLGFLFWNYNKAKIFMGDVGSTLLGYNVAIFTLYYANQEASNLWIWIILFGLFWFDATMTLFRRKLNGEKVSQAHKKHAYQRLTQVGWSHLKVTNYAIALNLILFCIIYFVSNIFIAFLITLIVLYLAMKFVDKKKGFQ